MTTKSASSHFTFGIVDRNSSESLFRFGKTLLCIASNSGAAFLESFFSESLSLPLPFLRVVTHSSPH